MSGFPILRTKRLVLREWQTDDKAPLVALLDNPNISRMLSTIPSPFTLADADELLRRMMSYGHTNAAAWAITLNGELIGSCGYTTARDTPTLGYWLAESHWGYGFMREALTAAFSHMFREHPDAVFIADVFTDNPQSKRTLEYFGAKFIGYGEGDSRARGPEVYKDWRLQLDRESFLRSLEREAAL
ncbi:GNAT family N-acetyltransferase [Pseudovibrio flavus]|uniref:GNAT family N-acetyltransferase n=1 Tax=Pseudovibrio flavus TaxID=2529854 RepID=UPI00211C8417|nr:GNAT family protein [Pseudovibrio flavus]